MKKFFTTLLVSATILAIPMHAFGSVAVAPKDITVEASETSLLPTYTLKQLQQALVEKSAVHGKTIFSAIEKDMEQHAEEDSLALETEYRFEVKADTADLMSVVVSKTSTNASAYTIRRGYTVHKQDNALMPLSSLFADEDYIGKISRNIKKQMKDIMKADDSKVFFIHGEDDLVEGFESIQKDNPYYINETGQLVILFDEYQVAPGYMGPQEFVVPFETAK